MSRFVFVVSALGALFLFSSCAGRPGNTCYVTQFSSPTADSDLGIGDSSVQGGGRQALAQSFLLSAKTTIKAVELDLYKVGTIADQGIHTIRVRLETNATGTDKPSDVLAAANAEAALPVSQLSTIPNFYTFTFPAPVTLEPGTYWLRVNASYNMSTTDLVKWVGHNGAGGFEGGRASFLNNTGWFTTDIVLLDLLFRINC